MRGKFAAPQLVNSCRLDKLLSFRQSLANSFDGVVLDFQGGGNGPHRKTISSNTCASQNVLLYLVQLFELDLDQLLKRYRHIQGDTFKFRRQVPVSINLR